MRGCWEQCPLVLARQPAREGGREQCNAEWESNHKYMPVFSLGLFRVVHLWILIPTWPKLLQGQLGGQSHQAIYAPRLFLRQKEEISLGRLNHSFCTSWLVRKLARALSLSLPEDSFRFQKLVDYTVDGELICANMLSPSSCEGPPTPLP